MTLQGEQGGEHRVVDQILCGIPPKDDADPLGRDLLIPGVISPCPTNADQTSLAAFRPIYQKILPPCNLGPHGSGQRIGKGNLVGTPALLPLCLKQQKIGRENQLRRIDHIKGKLSDLKKFPHKNILPYLQIIAQKEWPINRYMVAKRA